MTAVDLAARARRAYERGRLRWVLRWALAAAAVSALAIAGCPERRGPEACAALFVVLLTVCLWRGGPWARGARLGFFAGLAPCLVPAAVRAVHLCDLCGVNALGTMQAFCLLGG